MKVLHVSAFDSGGGAARAALRVHQALRQYGVDSHFLTVNATSPDDTVSTPLTKLQVAAAMLKRHAAAKITSTQRSPTNTVIHSLGQFSSGLGRWIESSDCDVVNLHWVCAEALSIAEIARIRKPIVWTMHDMWPFTGAEHYDDLDHPGRWKSVYTRSNRPATYRGVDIDKYVMRRKAKLWAKKTFHLVSPSNWLAECARASAVMRGQPCEVIPNPLDTTTFSPVDKREARRILGLPPDRKLILFGALGATSDPRKGYDLLVAALRSLARHPGVERHTEIVVFGGARTGEIPGLPLKMHFLGTLHDDVSIRVAYSAADVFVAPSRQDNLPNTVVEAGACGVPTAAFDVGGMSDIVRTGVTGVLAKAFDTSALAAAIYELLDSPPSREAVIAATAAKFSPAATVPAYVALYRRVLDTRAAEIALAA